MTIELIPYDGAKYFKTEEDQAELLADAFSTGDAHYISHVLGVIARARGMTDMEKETGIKRQQLYRALSTKGNPTLETFLKVIQALNITLTPKFAS